MAVYLAIILLGIYSSASKGRLCNNNAWPPQDRSQIKERVVNLDLAPEDRWTDLIVEHNASLIQLLDKTVDEFINSFHLSKASVAKMEHFMLSKILPSLPSEYRREIQGILKVVGSHEAYIVLLNTFYDFIALCTSTAQYDDALGYVVHVRNLDFGAMFGYDSNHGRWLIQEYIQPLLTAINFTSGGQTVFRSINIAGSVGILTGLRPKSFAVSVNARFAFDGGFLGILEQLFTDNADQAFVALTVRDVLSNPLLDYGSAVDLLSTMPLLSPVYLIVSGIRQSEACVVARARKRLVYRWDMQSQSPLLEKRLIVQTNYDLTGQQPIYDDRVNPVYRCVKQMEPGLTTIAKLYNALSSYPVAYMDTIHTTVMVAGSGYLQGFNRNFTD